MSDRTGIEWTDATWNPIRGCSRVSEGCRNCYAESVAARFSGPGQPYEGLATHVTRPDGTTEARWTGQVRVVESVLDQPQRWKRPRRIFVNSMSDLFHESVPESKIQLIFLLMRLADRHTFQVLTKRPERMLAFCTARDVPPLPNVQLGVSVEDQATADARIPPLLETPAAKRFISAEPLLGKIDIEHWLAVPTECEGCDSPGPGGGRDLSTCPRGACPRDNGGARLDWVIVGGESGRGARPMHPDWARSLRDQCTVAGVPFFFKQWGEWVEFDGPRCVGRRQDITAPKVWIEQDGRTRPTQPPSLVHSIYHHSIMARVGKKAAGALLDGREHREFPT